MGGRVRDAPASIEQERCQNLPAVNIVARSSISYPREPGCAGVRTVSDQFAPYRATQKRTDASGATPH